MAQVIKKENEIVIAFNDGTEASFSMPTITHLSMMIARRMIDPFGPVDVLVANCLIDGKKNLTQDVGYLTQIEAAIPQIFDEVECSVDWDDDHAMFNFSDGTSFAAYYAKRQQVADYRTKYGKNPVLAIKTLLKGLWIDGDQALLDSTGHMLALLEPVSEFSTRGAAYLKKK